MAVICVDTLAGVKYPEVIAQLPRKYGTRYFFEEFGNAKKQIVRDIQSGRGLIGVQGLWAGKSHNYTSSHRVLAIKIAKVLNQISIQFGKPIYYSPFCEHKKDKAYMLALFADIHKVAPKLILVNSPIRGGQFVNDPRYIDEIHHNDKPPGMPKGKFIFSMDGLHQPDCDITNYLHYLSNPNCIAFFVWALQHNCKKNTKDLTPAKQRKCKPTHDLNMSLIFQLENKKQAVSLQKGHISKSHAEQHENVDMRANELTYIGPKGARPKKVKIGTMDLEESGITDDGRPVFRSNRWAYKAGRVATVLVDGKSVGTVDIPFRQNEWKEKT